MYKSERISLRIGLALAGSHTLFFSQALPALLAMVRGFSG